MLGLFAIDISLWVFNFAMFWMFSAVFSMVLSLIANNLAQKLQQLNLNVSSRLDIIMDCRKNNSIWFDSPFNNSSRHDNLHLLKADVQHEPEQSVQLNYNLESPLQPPHKNTPKNTMSPWSKLLLYNENKQDQIQISNPISHQCYQNAIIEEKVVYSDPQLQEQITPPIKKEENQKQDSDAQRTTAKKQSWKHPISQRKAKILEKGLRKLSQRAFEIVRELKYATYKQVASMLAQQLNYLDLEGQNKEEQNIKRRVYDALNVLIALGVLRKDGRKIVSQSVHNKRNELNEIRNEELNCLRQKLQEKQIKISEKRQRFRQTEAKYKSVGTLLNRNKHKSYISAELVSFPFIGILLPEEMSLSMDVQKTRFILRSQQDPANIFGDMDCLKWLGDSLGERSLNQNIKERQQFIRSQCQIQEEWP